MLIVYSSVLLIFSKSLKRFKPFFNSSLWFLEVHFFRVGKQRLRESRVQAVDYIILCLAGVCLGVLAKMKDDDFGVLGYTFTVIAVCKSLFTVF